MSEVLKTEDRIDTDGGDSPGLDAVIHGVVYAARGLGYKVVGIREGYYGLLNPERSPDRGLMELRRSTVRGLSNLGGIVAADMPLVEVRAAPNDPVSVTLSRVCMHLCLAKVRSAGPEVFFCEVWNVPPCR